MDEVETVALDDDLDTLELEVRDGLLGDGLIILGLLRFLGLILGLRLGPLGLFVDIGIIFVSVNIFSPGVEVFLEKPFCDLLAEGKFPVFPLLLPLLP